MHHRKIGEEGTPATQAEAINTTIEGIYGHRRGGSGAHWPRHRGRAADTPGWKLVTLAEEALWARESYGRGSRKSQKTENERKG